MRLKLFFELENQILGIDYRKSIVSFIKHSLEEYNKELFLDLYGEGKTKKKSYTWAPILPKPVFQEDKVILSGTSFYIIFSVYNLSCALHLYNAFLGQKFKVFHLNKNSMALKNIVVLKEKEIRSSKILMKMSSPIVVRNHDRETLKDYYYSFEKEEGFNSFLRINILEQMKEEGLDSSLLENFSIKPINARKAVVKVYEYSIECSLGIFELTGKVELLRYLYKSGIRN